MFTNDIDVNSISKSIYLPTGNKYVDRDIQLNLSADNITLVAGDTFVLTDTVATWTWVIDADGNVTVS